jgi:nucleotide-binding universal stress UspA family protein
MIRRILVALDGSSRAPDVLAAAAEVGVRFDAILIPFRAVSIPPDFPAAAEAGNGARLAKVLDDTARAELASLVDPWIAPKAPPVVGHGPPWRAILHAAREHDVDLIVLGSHGYGGLDRALGTTAAQVVHHARRNLLVVHATEDERA